MLAGPDLKYMKAKRYYIGLNVKRERVKGEAVVEQLAELAK